MYSTCLFCKNSLGSNEAIEQFPVGRRLAFDAAKGRLWVVCRKCERWNLTPLEQRWEAIEACERSFRGTKLRTSTDQIGLARLSEGLELVCIGKPLRPEFAAWRYGDQFGARRKRHYMQTGAGLLVLGSIPLLGPLVGISLGGGGITAFNAVRIVSMLYSGRRIVARIPAPTGQLLPVRGDEVTKTVMLPPTGDEPWGLRITHRSSQQATVAWWRYARDSDETDIRGDDAVRTAAQLLPRINRQGASAKVVQEAVTLASRTNDPRQAFTDAAHLAARSRSWNDFGKGAKLDKIDPQLRLALEMISHEDSERRALEGELHLLEEAWRDAEEIAAISDNLFLPAEISTRLEELKRRGD